MTTRQQVRILSTLTTRDEAGTHFTQRYGDTALQALEKAGLIVINRPVHEAAHIPYSQEYWDVEITEDGITLVEAHPEYQPR